MTSFCHQLRLLLWKNYVLRKRHKMRIVLEILWPLFLFLILMWVRTRGLKLNKPACHVVEKALPSVGGFTFLQNYICSLNNTCFNQGHGESEYVENDAGKMWENATLPQFVRESGPLLLEIMEKPEGVDTVRRLWNDTKNYLTIIRGMRIKEQTRKLGTVKLSKLLKPVGVNGFLSTAPTYVSLTRSQLEEFLDSDVHLDKLDKASFDKVINDFQAGNCDSKSNYELLTIKSDELFQELCSLGQRDAFVLLFLFNNFMDKEGLANQIEESFEGDITSALMPLGGIPDLSTYDPKTMENLFSLFRIVATYFEEFSKILLSTVNKEVKPDPKDKKLNERQKEEKRSDDSFASGTALLYKMFCGVEVKPNATVFGLDGDQTDSFDSLRDRLRDWKNKKLYLEDPDVGPLCNTIFENLESRPFTSLLWKQVKPFIRGRILYYPHTPFTETLMRKVDSRFEELQDLEKTFNAVLTLLHRTRAWFSLHQQDLMDLQNMLKDSDTVETIMTLLGTLTELGNNEKAQVQKLLEVVKKVDFNKTDLFLENLDFGSEMESEVLSCIRYNKSTPYKLTATGGVGLGNVTFKSEDEAVANGMKLLADNNLWAVVIFKDLPKDGSAPRHLSYKIRMDSDKVDGTRFIRDRLTKKSPRRRPAIDLKYITNGFIYLQEMIEHSFVEETTGIDFSQISIYLQQFPFPCHIYDQFIRAISNTFPLFMVLSWVYASSMIVKSVVLEKEFRLKEVMKVMGCGNSVIWTAWFIDNFAVMTVSSIILSIILKYGKVIEHSDIFIIMFLIILFSIATICFSFFISTFFTRANSAAAAGGILFFITYLPYNFMLIWEDRLTWYHMLASCLFSNVAFGFGCTYLARLEEDGLGAQWDRITIRTLPDDDFNLSYCILMLIFDSFLYMSLTLYIEAVFPGDSGMPKPWYFLCQKSFWKRRASIVKEQLNQDNYEPVLPPDSASGHGPILEPDPEGATIGVSVRDLNKVYSNGRVALKNLNLTFYEDQITSFLGHNGAGKTTTISILTGLFPPTTGTAKIYGRDIRTDIDAIRTDLGVCPQFNVLFDRLTVEEHMLFYAGLKHKGDIMKEEMDQMLFDLGIPHKKNEFPRNLSGGMKRKLSVAIAFVGGSKTVFLDEPTSGVDPYSRRSIWELLLKYKQGRTIILTTHFMDEADLLGDRIAIISQGTLKACGSSLFLKSHFGQGYSLRLVKKEDAPSEDFLLNNVPPVNKSPSETANTLQVTPSIPRTTTFSNSFRLTELYKSFVRLRIPEAILIDDVGSDVVFLLPYSSINAFPTLFQDIDENLENLKISSYGISDTTLEDVFLQITVDDLNNNAAEASGSSICTGYCHTRRFWSAVWKMRTRLRRKKKKGVEIQDNPTIRVVEEETSISTATPQHASSSRVAFSGTLSIDVDDPDPDLSELEQEEADDKLLPIKSEQDIFGTKRELRTNAFSQIWIIIKKRFRNSNRNKKSIFFEIILPALFIALTLAFTLILPPPENEASREISYETYKPPNNIFFSIPKPALSHYAFEKTLSELTGPTGLGTPCTTYKMKLETKENNYHLCQPKSWSNKTVQNFNRNRVSQVKAVLGTCSCSSGAQLCPNDIEKTTPPKLKTQTGDFILDVSRYNLPEWVIKTYFKYEAKRYGGYEMMLRAPEDLTLTEYVSVLDSFSSGTPFTRLKKAERKPFYKIWFENRGWISSVAYLNALNNMLLRQSIPETMSKDKKDFGITLFTHPLNLTSEQQKKESLKTAALGVIHAICIIFALSFVPASFTVYLIEERKSGAKHLHLVSGVKPLTYWISTFTFDIMKYVFSALLCVTLFWMFDAKAYIGKESVGAFICLLALYGWASIPLMYPASFMFSIPSTAFVVLACSNLFIGVITTVSTFVLERLGDEELKKIGLILEDLFLIFPHYCLGKGLIELVKLHVEATAFGKISMDAYVKNRFEWRVLGKLLTCLAVHGVVFFIINLSIEYKQWCYLLCCKRSLNKKKKYANKAMLDAADIDADVKREEERVLFQPLPNATLRAENLFKIYHGKKSPAVNNLCFAVEPGECFGLLGVNGAGKTSTFKMLTGDIRITSGRASIMGLDIEKSLDSARKHYGYCPQEDGIDPLLNAYEQLELYGRLRGMTSAEVKNTAIQLVNTLGLKRYADKRCGTYSGGNKRKVSTAIALIGNPDLVFLDEPTSGMDPGARRQLWKLILQITHMGKSVVLTSHSMEECEALCSRLAIMVNGKFTCLGSLQHLKNRFGTGYMLTVRCEPVHQDEFIRSVTANLSCAKLDDVHCSQLKFNIVQDQVKLGEIFDVMCSAKSAGLIEDFSVSQTTLDDIFVKFASKQRDELDVKIYVDSSAAPGSLQVVT